MQTRHTCIHTLPLRKHISVNNIKMSPMAPHASLKAPLKRDGSGEAKPSREVSVVEANICWRHTLLAIEGSFELQ